MTKKAIKNGSIENPSPCWRWGWGSTVGYSRSFAQLCALVSRRCAVVPFYARRWCSPSRRSTAREKAGTNSAGPLGSKRACGGIISSA